MLQFSDTAARSGSDRPQAGYLLTESAGMSTTTGSAASGQEQRPRLLLVDDEADITSHLAAILSRSGFEVRTAADGAQALRAVQEWQPDLCVCDVMMPVMDGRELLRSLRAQGRWTPVILLTQVGEPFERAAALDEGADDYLNKPFDTQELIARIKAVLRRHRQGISLTGKERLRSGALEMDRVGRRVFLEGREVTLTPRAVALLDYLMSRPQELHTRERLLSAVWGYDFPVHTRAVDHRVAEVRRVLGEDRGAPQWIETVPGMGYRFAGTVEG